ncbi:MAG TPA: DUF2235 domain-containing protein [Caulobacteraceae bacterium]|jgi:uncharacterized protein (DUF2235 family)
MKTLVVGLDGTNQTKTQQHPTNIARIFDSLGGTVSSDPSGGYETSAGKPTAPLLGKYLPGVGTQGDPVLKTLGNLFGDGIAASITRGYTFLSRNYVAGDSILITGFSRGATAARALAGFVVGRGLLAPGTYAPGAKTDAYKLAVAAWYNYRQAQPNLANVNRPGLIGQLLGGGDALPTVTDANFIAPPPITAVGVFDTVSSLGLPHLDASGSAVYDYSICDTVLSDKVHWGFHALAADEMRDLFSPTFWADRDQIVQQIFPGCHSDVGGGYPNAGLSDAALSWMLDQFATVGLHCDRTRVTGFAPNSLAPAQDDGAVFPFNNTPRRARSFPECATLSASITARLTKPVEMLPSSAPQPYRPRGVYADGSAL